MLDEPINAPKTLVAGVGIVDDDVVVALPNRIGLAGSVDDDEDDAPKTNAAACLDGSLFVLVDDEPKNELVFCVVVLVLANRVDDVVCAAG